ncbi:MAG: tetratricopeptide repeat protein [Gemmatimonadetes bacterium]|nr:tetratricopeptide repeat protein [Gemmatimonadota bacterium]
MSELRRRKVFRAAAIYVVVAWAAVEVTDVVAPSLQLPEWTPTLVIVVALIGFPLALILSWAFDLTPAGTAPASSSSREATVEAGLDGAPSVGAAPTAESTAATTDQPESPTADRTSIAVLPFVNMSADAENEYFSDGMTEEMINALVGIEGLRVASRTSAFAFKGKDEDIREIGRQLGVGTVMEGSVRKAGNRLRLTAQLIAVEDGYHLWSETFDRELEDVFEVQEQIARSIAETLVPTLAASGAPLVKKSTESLEAYNLYLKGRYAWNKRVEAGLRGAVEYFEAALELDPDFASAWAGLADAYTLLGIAEYGFAPPSEVMPKAKTAALRALELDPSLAEAQTSIAHITGFFEWDVVASEVAFKRAIELDPDYAFAYHWYALLLAALERHDEALEAELKARELEPLSLIINKNVGTILYYGRRHSESLKEDEAALKLDPDYPRTLLYAALALDVEEDYDEAVRMMEEALSYDRGNTVIQAALGYTHALAGSEAEARRIVDELEATMETRYVPAFTLALIHTGLGDRDDAFGWLERAYEERSSWLLSLSVEPAFDVLRSDRRFAELVDRVRTAAQSPESS